MEETGIVIDTIRDFVYENRVTNVPTMKQLISLVLLFFLVSSKTAIAEIYQGQVGKLKAEFDIEWGGDNSVGGTYYYLSKPGKTYTLEGEFGADGKLVLREYTDGTLTAVLFLSDAGGGRKVRWAGKMKNTDGREFTTWFGE
jgi:hypothetical protein